MQVERKPVCPKPVNKTNQYFNAVSFCALLMLGDWEIGGIGGTSHFQLVHQKISTSTNPENSFLPVY